MTQMNVDTEIQIDVSYREGGAYRLYVNKKGLPRADDFVTVQVRGAFTKASRYMPADVPNMRLLQVEKMDENGENPVLIEDLTSWGTPKLKSDILDLAMETAFQEAMELQEEERSR